MSAACLGKMQGASKTKVGLSKSGLERALVELRHCAALSLAGPVVRLVRVKKHAALAARAGRKWRSRLNKTSV